MTTASDPSQEAEAEAEQAREHLKDVDDGCGCAEIWEHLSENRDEA
jgi:hypothetical protein